MQPKISVIIPAYNDSQFLEQTLQCWTAQTMKEIEIILVNDGSTDDSAEIMDAWAQKDDRIRVVSLPRNMGTWAARNAGVEQANGEYMMFADADDEIDPDACRILYKEMQEKPVDILHFGTEIIGVGQLTEAEYSDFKKGVEPYHGKIRGKDILVWCFCHRIFSWNLCNKIFTADIVKKALLDRGNDRMIMAEDAFAFFLIAYYSKSYRGYAGKPFYRYFWGRGVTGKRYVTEKGFRALCDSAMPVRKMKEFLLEQDVLEDYLPVYRSFAGIQIEACFYEWRDRVDEADKVRFLDILLEAWPVCEIAAYLAPDETLDLYRFAKYLRDTEKLRFQPRPVRTVAAYYVSAANGGIERVMNLLCILWVRMGYRVILITDDRDYGEPYPYPDEVIQCRIPDVYRVGRDAYLSRAEALQKCIEENHVDAVVYHAWYLETALWDSMVIKAAGASVIFHCHGIFTFNLFEPYLTIKMLMPPAFLADSIVTLSRIDRSFWSHFHPNVFQVNNPFTADPQEWDTSSCAGHDILFIARLSEEKRPFDTLKILQSVVQAVPDARLHIAGSGSLEKKLRKAIQKMGLSQCVVMHGFQMDVKPLYLRSSVLLCTSVFEGYPMSLQEGMLAGLPIVMYDLPHLTLVQDNPGIISVPQQDTEAAARAIIDLLQNEEKRKQIGQEGRRFAEQLSEYDYEGVWKRIFDSVGQEHFPCVSEDDRLMLETLILHQEHGAVKARYYNRTLSGFLQTIRQVLRTNGLRGVLKKTVRKILPHKVVKGLQMLCEKGFRITMIKIRRKLFRG